jgi:MerR family transcriptional regulator/heat shock protein HspR
VGGDAVPADARGLFAISVAAERADLPIQNLRVYERRGLLEPARTAGGTRLYSEADIVVLRRIVELLADGLNLAGIRRVLDLESEVTRLRAQLDVARRHVTATARRSQHHVGFDHSSGSHTSP